MALSISSSGLSGRCLNSRHSGRSEVAARNGIIGSSRSCGRLTSCCVEFDPNSFELDDPQVVELADRLALPPAVVQAVLTATFADLSRFRRPEDRICFEGLRPTVLQALAHASGQPASVVTLVLTGLSDWFEAHASGVVVKGRIGLAPDPEGNGNLPPQPEYPPS